MKLWQRWWRNMLDVSEVITDPDFAQVFTVRMVNITVSADGETAGEKVVGPHTDTDWVGIIEPLRTDQVLAILPEGERDNDAIRAWTLDPIPAGNFILYKGRQWKVVAHKDWTDFGYWWSVATDTPHAAS